MESKRSPFKLNIFHLYHRALGTMVMNKAKFLVLMLFVYIPCIFYTINTYYTSGFFADCPSFMLFAPWVRYSQLIVVRELSTTVYNSITFGIKLFCILDGFYRILMVVPAARLSKFDRAQDLSSFLGVLRATFMVPFAMEACLRTTLTANAELRDSPNLIALNIVALLCFFFISFMDSIFLQVDYFQKSNMLTSTDPHMYVWFFLFKFVHGIFYSTDFVSLPYAVFVAFAVVLTIVQIAFFLYMAIVPGFEKQFSNGVTTAFNSVTVLTGLALFLMIVWRVSNVIALFCLLLIPLFALIIHVFFQKRELYRKIKFPLFIQMVEQTNYLVDLGKKCEPHSRTAIVLRGLLKRHQDLCDDPHCFCHQPSHFEASKNTYLDVNLTKHINLYTKYYIIRFLTNELDANPRNHYLRYLLAEFYARKMKNYLVANRHISHLLQESLSLPLQLRVYGLQRFIFKEQEELNRERLKEKSLEELLRFEEAYNHVLLKISDLYKTLLGFWGLMYQADDISKTQFKESVAKILELKADVKAILKVLQNYSAFNKHLNFLVNFVKRELLNSKNQVNLEDVFLMLKDDEQLSMASTTSFLNNNFYSFFFNRMSCVVTIELDDAKLGLIKRVSESIETMFGYTRREVLGQNIKILMTDEIARHHDQILHRVAHHGIFLSKTNTTETYAMDKDRRPVKVRLTYKLNLTLDSEAELAAVIVPNVSHSEENLLMIVNEFGFVTSISPALANMLEISPENVEKNNFNVGMFNELMLEFIPARAFLYRNPKIENHLALTNKIFEKNIFHQIEFRVFPHNSEAYERLFLTFQSLKEMTLDNVKEIIENKNKYTFDPITNRFLVQPLESTDKFDPVSATESDSDNVNMSMEKLSRDLTDKFSRFGQVVSEKLDSDGEENSPSFFMDFEFLHYKGQQSIEIYVFKFVKVASRDLRTNAFRINHSHVFKENASMIKDNASMISERNLADADRSSAVATERQVKIAETSDDPDEQSSNEATFLSYLKKPINLFWKDKAEVPSRQPLRLKQITGVFFFYIFLVCALEVVVLLLVKSPTISNISGAAGDFVIFKDFESSLINSYSNFLSLYFNPGATKMYLGKYTSNIMADFRSVYVRLLLFSPSLGETFLNSFQPNFNMTMDYTFLAENYMYFTNSLFTRSLTTNPITPDEYTFTMGKYKGMLLTMLQKINRRIYADTVALLTDFNFKFLIYIAVFLSMTALAFLVLIFLYNQAFQGCKKIYETFLYISDAKVYEIGSYLTQSYRFYERQFNMIEDADKGLFQSPAEFVATDKKKSWKSGKETFVEGVIFLNILNVFVLLAFCGIFVAKYFLTSSLISQLHSMHTTSQQMYQSEITISSLIMNAKDFAASPASLAVLPDDYLASLKSNLTTSVSFNGDSSSLTQSLAASYNSYLCAALNLSAYNNTINCSTYQAGLLNNGVDSIKNIMNSNLGFIFGSSNSNSSAASLKETYASFDVSADLIRTGIRNILANWLIDFQSRASSYNYLMIALSVLFIVLTLIKAGAWVLIIRAALARQHEYARKVFSHLIPSDTLNLNKFIRVQLINSKVME